MTENHTTRRDFLALTGAAAAAGTVPLVTVRPAAATPATLAAANAAPARWINHLAK